MIIKESQLRALIREAIDEYGTIDDIRASVGGGRYYSPKQVDDYGKAPRQTQFKRGSGKIDYATIQLAGTIPTVCDQIKTAFPRCNEYQVQQLNKVIEKLQYIEDYIKNIVNNTQFDSISGSDDERQLVAEGFWGGMKDRMKNMFNRNEEPEMETVNFNGIIDGIKKVYQLTSTIIDKKLQRSLQGTLRFAVQILNAVRRGE